MSRRTGAPRESRAEKLENKNASISSVLNVILQDQKRKSKHMNRSCSGNNRSISGSRIPDKETYLSYFKTKKFAKENSFDFSPAEYTLNLSCQETNSKPNIAKKLANILDSTQKESIGGPSKGETVPKNLFHETMQHDSFEMSSYQIKHKPRIDTPQEPLTSSLDNKSWKVLQSSELVKKMLEELVSVKNMLVDCQQEASSRITFLEAERKTQENSELKEQVESLQVQLQSVNNFMNTVPLGTVLEELDKTKETKLLNKSKELTANIDVGKENKAESGHFALPSSINIKAVLEENERLKTENQLLKVQTKKALELAVQLKKMKITKLSMATLSSQQNSVSEPLSKENIDPELTQILDSPNRSNSFTRQGLKRMLAEDKSQSSGVFKRTIRQQKTKV